VRGNGEGELADAYDGVLDAGLPDRGGACGLHGLISSATLLRAA
jgi:hypothetical protein